jgi:hypothetical protein
MGGRRGRVLVVAIALSGLVGWPTVAAGQAPVPAPSPAEGNAGARLSVTAVDLVDRQEIVVTGTGWNPRDAIVLRQCVRGSSDFFSPCEDHTGPGQVIRSGAEGRFRHRFTVEAILDTDPLYDCRVRICILAAWGNAEPQAAAARLRLHFDPDGPDPVAATAQITPDADLVDGQEVHVSVDGVLPDGHGSVSASTCLTPEPGDGRPDCRSMEDAYWEVVDGHAEGDVTLDAGLIVADGFHDCRQEPCVLRLSGNREVSEDAFVPLAFDPEGPPPLVPVVTATPDEDLTDGQTVAVDGQHFDREVEYFVLQCPVGAPQGACDDTAAAYGAGQADGSFQDALIVTTIIHGEDGSQADCRAVPCELRVSVDGSDAEDRTIPLGFDPAGEVFEPWVTVTPMTGLVDRQRVAVHGEELHPFEGAVSVIQCVGRPAVVGPGEGHCDPRWDKVIESGTSFDTTYVVHRRIRTRAEGRVDCRIRHCRIWVFEAWRSHPIAAPGRLVFRAP